MKRLAILLLFLVQIFTHASAQHILDITLVVSGEGATMQEATGNALRSAIEQTYGTFISANTAVLNDELIRDEIVSVSSGNIENYEEISHSTTADGTCVVNLQVTVSLSKLTSYAKSKGSSAELAGNTFAMNMKLRKLNKENEKAALENLLQQVEILSKDMFDFKMVVGEPRIAGEDGVLYVYDRGNDYGGWIATEETSGYYIPITVITHTNKNTKLIISKIFNTLTSLSLNEEEVNYYKQHSIPYFTIKCEQMSKNSNYRERKDAKSTTYYLRSFEYIDSFIEKLVQIINHASYGYKIVANNNPNLYYTLATSRECKPQVLLTDNSHFYWSELASDQVLVYAALYNNWIGENDQIVNIELITEAWWDYKNNRSRRFVYNTQLMDIEGIFVKSDNITLFVKEPEMMELTGLQLIP